MYAQQMTALRQFEIELSELRRGLRRTPNGLKLPVTISMRARWSWPDGDTGEQIRQSLRSLIKQHTP